MSGAFAENFLERHAQSCAKYPVPVILAEFLKYVERSSEKGPYIEPPLHTAERFCVQYEREVALFELLVIMDAFYQFCGCSSQFAVQEVWRKADLKKELQNCIE